MFYVIVPILLIFLHFLNVRKRPAKTESDLSNALFPFMHLYYASKYLTPVKKAAWKSDFESYFSENKAPENREELQDSQEIRINAVGDVMMRSELTLGNPEPLWELVGPELFGSDITFGNMEFAVNNNWLIDRTIRYSMSEVQADIMVEDKRFGKFDIMSVGNNHINDSLSEGIYSSLRYLDSKGILHVGASKSQEDVDKFPIIEKKGIKTAFLSYTFSTNGIPLEKDCQFGTNLVRFNAINPADYDPSLIHKHIAKAREEGADIIVASLHWGVEFEYYPSQRIVERGHELLEKGVDIIIGHHPHIINPSEWYRTRDGRDTLCLYSLNGVTTKALITVQQNMGQIAGITLEKGFDSEKNEITRIKEVELTPTYFMHRGKGKKSCHRVLPLFETAEKLENGEIPEYINLYHRLRLRFAYREYKKYFQQKYFQYK